MTKFGLVGEKLGHTFSPMIHKHIFKHLSTNASYDVLEYNRSEVSSITAKLMKNRYKGVNVTIPYKTELMQYMDNISDEAKKIGAINTIKLSQKNENVSLKGYNTDYYGFRHMLEHNNVELKNKSALILGTGGVSGAVYQCLVDGGVSDICFASSHMDIAKHKYPDEKIIGYDEISSIKSTDIVINCTPVGMKGFSNKSIIEERDIVKYNTVVDLIYNPVKTPLLKIADKSCEKSINGLYMLVAQAVKSEEIWNDIIIDKKIIDEIMLSITNEIKGDKIE